MRPQQEYLYPVYDTALASFPPPNLVNTKLQEGGLTPVRWWWDGGQPAAMATKAVTSENSTQIPPQP
ncbi:hypothetical protein LXL04_031621 [Taraxacum kok-saghyz]